MNDRPLSELRVYTIQEVAQIVKIDRRNVYRYVKDGRLRASKIGGVWRVTEDNLRAFLDRGANVNRR